MNKNILKTSIAVCALTILLSGHSLQASEITGTLTTGIQRELNSTITGNVVSGTTTPGTSTPPTTSTSAAVSNASATSGGGGITSFGTDSNRDGRVDILDFVNLMANWGRTGFGISADFNNDGRVDILDFVLLMAQWTR